MNTYKVEVHGVGPSGSLVQWFEAQNDSQAVQIAARTSMAISVSHQITVSSCSGITATRGVIDRYCSANEAW